jgi:hypothetical protein
LLWNGQAAGSGLALSYIARKTASTKASRIHVHDSDSTQLMCFELFLRCERVRLWM